MLPGLFLSVTVILSLLLFFIFCVLPSQVYPVLLIANWYKEDSSDQWCVYVSEYNANDSDLHAQPVKFISF